MALAEQYGFTDYAQPAGGCCFLTDKNYSEKLVDLWTVRGHKEYELDDIMLLKVGRHIRPNKNFKMIIAREDGENKFLQGYKKTFVSMVSISHGGPLVLIDGKPTEADLELAARITARYGQGRDADEVEVKVMEQGIEKSLYIKPLARDELPKEWHV
jgi:hypothetical protein